ncbi:MAG TPA: NAD(P)/FAD-dependent oxidoreductase [Roseiarcus sp.]|nr:NAD(P)/FAD-dependent oxidoreductase [Roseiarcus sp.]
MADEIVEVVVIGGGAAGVAAARRLTEAGVPTLLIEARDRLGGRARTILDSSGFALDLGCGWLHSADRNPWVEIALSQGCAIDRTPPPWSRSSPQPGFRAGEQSSFIQALMNYRARVDSIGEEEPDRAAAAAIEPDNRWRGLLNAISTFYSGAELDRVSAQDLARYDDSGVNWRIPEGYGRVVAAYGQGLRVKFDCAVERIDRRGRRLRIETTNGVVSADVAVVTLPSALIAERPELFLPTLPDKTEAAAGLPLGLADKLFLSLESPEQFEKDSRCFGRTDRTETGAYQMRPFGRPMVEAYFGGELAADLEKAGQAAFADFALDELAGLFGSEFRRRVSPIAYHGWSADPLARGSYSYALPGMADRRAMLGAPVEERLFFAGEACSREGYSTAHGAYATGLQAADRIIAALGQEKSPAAERTAQA